MRKRKTVTVLVGTNPEVNRFDRVKKIRKFRGKTGSAVAKENAEKALKYAKDFEEFLWDNADAEFYKELRNAMNERRMLAGV